MPIIEKSSYPGPPWYLANRHLETIFPSMFRSVEGVNYQRERLELSDGDFLDLDWLINNNERLLVVTHGLEGDSHRPYIKGTAKLFASQGWDVVAWNCRSCSGEMNRNFRLYDHGEIGDIGTLITHALQTRPYRHVSLVGYSMGGNITLKYLGVGGTSLPPQVKSAVAVSAPTDIRASSNYIENGFSAVYKKRFMKKLRLKVRYKAHKFPGSIDISQIDQINDWARFDAAYSCKFGGYRDADDFYYQTSAQNFTHGIHVPTLLLNSKNDPILDPVCWAETLAADHPHLYLETPTHGGHVGFTLANDEFSWAERRALEFIHSFL